MDRVMTIEEVLKEAYDRIEKEHRVSVDEVRYRLVDVSTPSEQKHVVKSIEFTGTALR